MKIAQVCPYDFSRPGGVKSHIENLALQLRTFGHEVKIIAPNVNAGRIDDKSVKLIGKNRSTNIWGGTKIDVNIARGDEKKDLENYLESEKFDIIHFHNGWTPFMAWQVRYYSKTRHVATFHDTPADTFLGKKIVGKFLMPLAAKFIERISDALISVSASQAKYVSKWLAKKPEIIPNGINLIDYNPDQEPLKLYQDGKFNLLFLGRFEERKGLFFTLEAFRELKVKYDDLRLLIAGDGDQRAQAEQFVANHALADVIFLGFVADDLKASLIRTADLMLATAIYGESFGIVLLEAMASGTPVVGFGNEGYLNVITEPWDEFFPKPRDIQQLINKIEALYLDKELRESMTKWGLEEVKKYEWKYISRKIEKVYYAAMKGK